MKNTEELAALFPIPVGLAVGGKTLLLSPLRVGQLPAFSRAIAPLVKALEGVDVDLVGLIGAHTDDVVTAASVAVGEPREWIERLTVGELVVLIAQVIEVNADFFTNGVMPRIAATVQQLAAMPAAGSTSSNG